MKKILIGVIAVLALAVAIPAQSDKLANPAASLNGKWQGETGTGRLISLDLKVMRMRERLLRKIPTPEKIVF